MSHITHAKRARALFREGRTKSGFLTHRITGYSPASPRVELKNPYEANPTSIFVAIGEAINWQRRHKDFYLREYRRRHKEVVQ